MSLPSSASNWVKTLGAAAAGVAVGLFGNWAFNRLTDCKSSSKTSFKPLTADQESKLDEICSSDVKEFENQFDIFLDQFLAHCAKHYDVSPEHADRLQHMCVYNCKGGKMLRGLFVVRTARSLCLASGQDFEALKIKAYVLGWSIEILQAVFLVADDIMDHSETRRGRPCWYKIENVQMDAVNDALILESFIHFMLEKYFADDANKYLHQNLLYQRTSFQTKLGQMVDLLSQPQGRKGPEIMAKFNLDLYKKIVRYKTAYYTFYYPVAAGMLLCGFSSEAQMQGAEKICVELGEKFQIQDDYLDCYGDPKHIGKIGTDIKDHKCSWLVVQALQRVTAQQRKDLESWYGDEKYEANVKDLYLQLDLTSVYEQQEENSYKRITAMIEDIKDLVPNYIFKHILSKIHRRTK